MDFSATPKSAKKQKKSKSAPVVTVTEVCDEHYGSHYRRQSDIRKGFLKWFKRQHRSQTSQNVNDSHFFEQARAYEVVEPLVPLLVTEQRPKSYPRPVFGDSL
ncbi:hypothetical protein CB0940_05988 [Cercospora beticola]|uniref:Uncharacterized protein n=1 Tax=Cercospora beticola TaxID=122368 RepID=A0A2G5I0K3_CERBT|nr:hypothetical protein CB0940_05988 [Cercospora beticola]PIA98345.1 hypothetical protein CB0940_05988 [Cercospora beticola]WPA98591.1 hypothetical protein RHO25_003203 [Cercospora beticola]